MDASTAVLRPVAWSLYAIGTLIFLAPLGDLAASVGSLNPGAVPWRFGVAGLLSGALVLPMVGLGLWLAAAALLEHRGFLRALSVLAAILFLVVVVTLVVFALDTLQVRVQVRPDARPAFDLAALKAALTFLLEGVVLAVLTVNLHRAARAVKGTQHARRAETSPLLVQSKER
jgi:hypothetical protein